MPDPFLLTYQLPQSPASDSISKLVLKSDFAKDIITKALFDLEGGTYSVGDAEWNDGSHSDIVYVPLDTKHPPVIIEVQYKVDNEFMVRATQYCAQAYFRHGKRLPILLIFNTHATNIQVDNLPRSPNLGGYLLSCEYWAEKVVLINATTTTDASLTTPFHMLSKLLVQDERSLMESESWRDPIMQRLITIVKENATADITSKKLLLDTISSICASGISTFERILDTADRLQYDSPGVRSEAKEQIAKLSAIKRRHELIEEQTEDDSQGSSSSSKDEVRFLNTMKYVDDFKEQLQSKRTKKGKAPAMNWIKCYNELKKQVNVIEYANSESLRSQYTKYKKSLTKK